MMNKLYILLAGVVVMALVGCGSEPTSDSSNGNDGTNTSGGSDVVQSSGDQYNIQGTIVNTTGPNLYLDHLTLTGSTTIDTTTIGADGSFQFLGNVKEKGIHLIRHASNASWVVMLDNGYEVNASYDVDDIFNYTVTGSGENGQMVAFNNKMIERQKALTDKNQAYIQAMNNGQTEQAAALQAEVQALSSTYEDFVKEFTDTATNPYVKLYGASFLNVERNLDLIRSVTVYLETEIPGSVYAKEYRNKVTDADNAIAQQELLQQNQEKLVVGGEAMDITQNNPDGQPVSLSSLRGNIVLVDFWASWCKPCRVENPNVVKLYNTYKDQGFTIYSVSLDNSLPNWKSAIEADGLTWPHHVSDLQGWNNAAAKQYGVNSIPATFLLDRNGKIIAKNLRGQALEVKLHELFGG